MQYGDTPLHTSARYGHAGVTRILVSAECKVSEQNKVRAVGVVGVGGKRNQTGTERISNPRSRLSFAQNGDTALHIAAAMGRRKLSRILLEAGCTKSLRNKVRRQVLLADRYLATVVVRSSLFYG